MMPYLFAKFAPPWYFNEEIRLANQKDEAPLDDQEGLMVFIRQYGEGAWVTLSLLNMVQRPYGYSSDTQIQKAPVRRLYDAVRQLWDYPNLHMLEIPAITGKEPFQVWQDMRQVKAVWWKLTFPNARPLKNAHLLLEPRRMYGDRAHFGIGFTRGDALLLSEELEKRGANASPEAWWNSLDEQTQNYLIFRACDLVAYGEVVADRTFPQPTLPGISSPQLTGVVTALTMLLIEAQMEKKVERDDWWVSRKEAFLDECMWKNKELLEFKAYNEVHQIARTELTGLILPPRVLATSEIETLKPILLQELPHSQGILATIDDFVHFCRLLRQPENHVKGVTAQYVETEVNSYTTQEMSNQMAQELVDLPRFTAYAKVIQEVNNTQIVRKAKIQTARLEKPQGLIDVGRDATDNAIAVGILQKRSDVDKEIAERQAQWRRESDDDSPPTLTGGDKPPLPPRRPTTKSESPPPTHYIPSQPPNKTPPTINENGDC